jgi:DNA-binding NarL/FixJ family response regulator
MGSDPVRVAVVSSQAVVAHGLSDLLARHPDRVTVVTFPDGVDPDVVLYDVVDLVDGDLSELEELLQSTSAKVLAVSRDLRPDLVARALAVGADGFFSIGVSERQLLDAVTGEHRNGADGGIQDDNRSRLGGDVGLTPREVEVLTLIAQGRTNREIAQHLYLSPNSIKTYVRTAYRKIGAASRSQAVSWAIRNGFPADHP